MNIANTATVPSSQIIAVAKSRLGIDNTDSDLFFKIELNNCMRNYRSNDSVLMRREIVELKNRTFTVPSGLLKIVGMRRECDETEAEEDNENNFPWIVIANFYRGYYPGCGCWEDYFYIGQDGFGHARTGEVRDGNYTLTFWGYNVNGFGEMTIAEHYEDFLADYLCHRWLLRPVNQMAYSNSYLGRDAQTLFYKSYVAKKEGVKSLENKMNFKAQKQAISYELNRVYLNNLSLLFSI